MTAKKILKLGSRKKVIGFDTTGQCDGCKVNAIEHSFVNGEEKRQLCEVCLKETLYDLVLNNDSVSFQCDNGTVTVF